MHFSSLTAIIHPPQDNILINTSIHTMILLLPPYNDLEVEDALQPATPYSYTLRTHVQLSCTVPVMHCTSCGKDILSLCIPCHESGVSGEDSNIKKMIELALASTVTDDHLAQHRIPLH